MPKSRAGESNKHKRRYASDRKGSKMLGNMGNVCLDTIFEGSDLVIEEKEQKSHRR